jgi:hypothetical protein
VTQCTVVRADLVGPLVTVTTYIVKIIKVGPVVAGETVSCSVITHKFHRMYAQLRFSPGVGRGVTVFAGQGICWVVGTYVAGVTIGEMGIQIALQVAVQAHSHGADHLPRDGIESVPHMSMAIATEYPAR